MEYNSFADFINKGIVPYINSVAEYSAQGYSAGVEKTSKPYSELTYAGKDIRKKVDAGIINPEEFGALELTLGHNRSRTLRNLTHMDCIRINKEMSEDLVKDYYQSVLESYQRNKGS